ncbi:MAG: VCBS repeat-containing protein [Desulfobacteraceae bacterium]|nr:VCBS repeat-containing protein [Desulfobacteraceae bacterium]
MNNRWKMTFLKTIRCLCLPLVFALGLLTIIATGGGGESGVRFTLETYVAVADLNGDSFNDIAVTKVHIYHAPPHPGYVSVLLQNPNAPGSFMPVTEYPVGSDPWFVAVSDVNADTLPDLIVANEQSHTISILLQASSANGSFVNSISFPTGKHPMSIAIDDLNGDTLADIAVGGSDLSLHFQDPSNPVSFLPVEKILVDPDKGGNHVAIGDIDADGLPDLVISQGGYFSIDTITCWGGSVSVFLQDEKSPGVFNPAITSPAADSTQPTFVAINEFNADGSLDLAVVNHGTPQDGSTASVSILHQDPITPGAFLPPVHYATGFRSSTVAISDLDADGLPDLAVSNSGILVADYGPFIDTYGVIGSVSVLLHDSTNPGNFLPAKNYEDSSGYHAVAIGDLNGDSKPDLAIASDGVPVLFQDPTRPGQFLPRVLVETGSSLPD